jgi:hypothetical protein
MEKQKIPARILIWIIGNLTHRQLLLTLSLIIGSLGDWRLLC